MPPRSVDPARLNGEALMNWYRRSPADIAQERQAAEAERYRTYFGKRDHGAGAFEAQQAEAQPAQGVPSLFVQDVYRPGDEGEFTAVAGKNRSHRRRYEKEHGHTYPKTETGRNYDVAHIEALGDGGADVYENTRPMHPDDHRKEHMDRGDFKRWGGRSGQGKGGGPKGGGGGTARGLGVLSVVPWITGMLSGRIRTDSFDNYISDLIGVPSQEDREKYLRENQKKWNPNWKPGDPLKEPPLIA